MAVTDRNFNAETICGSDSRPGKAIPIVYGRPGRKHYVLCSLFLLALLYALAYSGLRVCGQIRPFYNQGSYEMDADVRVAKVFWPLMLCEEAWHNSFTDPPTGG